MSPTPFFLSLDGLDGAGKSTQCRLLAQWLREKGRSVTECVDPGGTDIGRALRDILLDNRRQISSNCEMFLFMSSRAQLVDEVIRPALDAGKTVICDRFLLANVVYQGRAGGLNVDDIWSIGRFATGGLEPDLTVVLDLPVEESLRRRSAKTDRIESRDMEFHQRVRDGFRTEVRRNPDKIRIIDATPPAALVQEEIRRAISI